jgi:hypothetical protein
MPRHSDPEQSGVYEKFNFRLNLSNPKERVIWQFLQSHASSRDASRAIKQVLYEAATGLSWMTNQPLRSATAQMPMPVEETAKPLFIEEDLEDLEAGLDSWLSLANA